MINKLICITLNVKYVVKIMVQLDDLKKTYKLQDYCIIQIYFKEKKWFFFPFPNTGSYYGNDKLLNKQIFNETKKLHLKPHVFF